MAEYTATMEIDAEYTGDEDERRAFDELQRRFEGVIHNLESEATKRVGDRRPIEQRMLEDLEQYHSREQDTVMQGLLADDKSTAFINITRPKSNSMIARLTDLLFPTDDKNYGIRPTPVPELQRDLDDGAARLQKMDKQRESNRGMIAQAEKSGAPPEQVNGLKQQNQELAREADELDLVLQELRDDREEARRRADLMLEEIDDQLVESRYQAECRDIIEDACKVGTGVLLGPIAGESTRRRWVPDEDGTMTLEFSKDPRPSVRRIDYWSWFPDMRTRNAGESEGHYLRHLMQPKQVRKLGKYPGFNRPALRDLLKTEARESVPEYLSQLRTITGDTSSLIEGYYHVWQYIGPISMDDLRVLETVMRMTEEDMGAEDIAPQDEEDIDPLAEANVIIWFSQGKLLKLATYPLDSGDSLISVFNLEKDESSPFGFGIPYLIRHEQKIINGAVRRMMDNAGYSMGPQILINKEAVEPQNGVWKLEANKIWVTESHIPKDSRAMETFNIDSRQAELAAIIEMARMFIDDVTSMPAIAEGEQGGEVTKTHKGMALLMNSANVMFRRIVKNFDDDITIPKITAFYDWNMQFSERESIKGDFDIQARGSSVLMVREMQASNLMLILDRYSEHPTFGPMLRQMQAFRELFAAHGLPASDFVYTDTEIEENAKRDAQEQADAAENDPMIKVERQKADAMMAKIDSDVAIAEMKADADRFVAQMKAEVTILDAELRGEISREEGERRLDAIFAKIASDERKMAAEIAVSERIGPSGGGYV